MIVKDDFLSQLRRYFALNLYEVKIWAALLSRGVSTAGELSDIANVPRSRSYDVLESLEKKGFVVMKLGKPIKYLTVDPNEVVERVKKNMNQEAKDRIARLDGLKDSELLTELESLHSQGVELVEPSDLNGALRGRHNLYNHMELMIKRATKSVDLMTTTQGFIRKAEGFRQAFEKISKNGVSVRVLAPLNEDCMQLVKELDGIAKVRSLNNPRARFCVVDSTDYIYPLMDDEEVHQTYDTGVWSKTAFHGSTMSGLFDLAWNMGTDSKDLFNK